MNTSKQVGDPEHIKVFATTDAAEKWFEKNDPEGVALIRGSGMNRIGRRTAYAMLLILMLAIVWQALGSL
ncbi:hypothetical protein V1290_000237 [Bradyrhizobium sp. AZCC 1578]|uniref:hypothetical protein n=1 Tax=Bradyrhizobium sp. AZCC 1578 TaxID=3117027 RepID=UPI002FF3B680